MIIYRTFIQLMIGCSQKRNIMPVIPKFTVRKNVQYCTPWTELKDFWLERRFICEESHLKFTTLKKLTTSKMCRKDNLSEYTYNLLMIYTLLVRVHFLPFLRFDASNISSCSCSMIIHLWCDNLFLSILKVDIFFYILN